MAGHSIADSVFALADAEVTDYLHRRFLGEGLVIELPTLGLTDWWGIENAIADDFPIVVHVARPAYCDDAFVPVFAEAADITNKRATVASIVQATYAKYGLEINFSKGKTESVIRFRGKGSAAAKRRHLVIAQESVIQCVSYVNKPFSLRNSAH